jgi:predicted short-subunit dehydrogenase-like oxidoreductase (DUF2520 family)
LTGTKLYPSPVMKVRIIGEGRAGGSLGRALARAGWSVHFFHRHDDIAPAASAVDVVVIAAPDAAISTVARRIEPVEPCAVIHLSGALGLDVLEPHRRRGSLHPLVSLPNPEIGSERLIGAWMAIAGVGTDEIAQALRARTFPVSDEVRALYHATAVVASNHLVALLGQVARLADACDVPFEAFLALAFGSLQNVTDIGPSHALTGPVARGDWDTVAKHLAALPTDEREMYCALARAAARLANRDFPEEHGPHQTERTTPDAAKHAEERRS